MLAHPLGWFFPTLGLRPQCLVPVGGSPGPQSQGCCRRRLDLDLPSLGVVCCSPCALWEPAGAGCIPGCGLVVDLTRMAQTDCVSAPSSWLRGQGRAWAPGHPASWGAGPRPSSGFSVLTAQVLPRGSPSAGPRHRHNFRSRAGGSVYSMGGEMGTKQMGGLVLSEGIICFLGINLVFSDPCPFYNNVSYFNIAVLKFFIF